MILSILICTLPERKHFLDALLNQLVPQVTDEVEVLMNDKPRGIPTGTKRNLLISQATGDYVCFIDDDDEIAPDYVFQILKAIKSGFPDCVTFEGYYTENGRNRLDWVIKLGEKYEARHENGKYMIFRYPNHLAVIKRSLASQVKFHDVHQREDYLFATELRDRKLLKTSNHIPMQLYHYRYISNK